MRVGQLAAAALELGDVALGGLGALHHLELDVLELALPPGSEVSSCWMAWRSLAEPVPASSRAWSRAARSRTSCTSDSALATSRCTSPSSVRERTSWSSMRRALPCEVGELGELRQVAARVGDLVEPGVDGLEVEQPQLAGGLGVHVIPPGSAPTTKVHGSVRTVLMWVSTLVARSPRAARSARSARASHDLLARPVPRVDEVRGCRRAPPRAPRGPGGGAGRR